jgi:protein phosphatase
MVEVTPTQVLQLRGAGATDLGKKRKHNEDHIAVRDDLFLYVVADGAGGHNAGEVASALAVRSITNYVGATVRATWDKGEFDRFGIPTGARRISAAVHKANRDVYEISKTHQRHRGMGTTVVAAAFSPRSGLLHVAHVGDSRCYRCRGGHFELLTLDHSLLTDVLEHRPELDEATLAKLPKNVVTRALGIDDDLRVSVRSYQVVEGDRYMLCSDGLSAPVPAPKIAAALVEHADPEQAVAALIALANDAGGPDNVAVIVIDCQGGYENALPASASYPPPGDDAAEHDSDPELLILGIEELDLNGAPPKASGDLLAALGDMISNKRSQ